MENFNQFGICKFINYKTPTLERAYRLSAYMQALSRTNPTHVVTNYISKTNAANDIETIEKRWQPRGHRSFKQGIISFGLGQNELPADKALKVTEETLRFFDYYPWLAVVHINKPDRIHSHFLLGTTNVHTGKKLSQGPKDLRKFKEYASQIAEKYDLPRILMANLRNIPHRFKSKGIDDKGGAFMAMQETEYNKVPDLRMRESEMYSNTDRITVPYDFGTVPSESFQHEEGYIPVAPPKQIVIIDMADVLRAHTEGMCKAFQMGWQTARDEALVHKGEVVINAYENES